MIIFRNWQGRFGNQLFQYSFGRILHMLSGRAVSFPTSFSIDLWKPESIPGRTFGGRPFKYRVPQSGFDFSVLDWQRPLEIRGFFEDYKYYAPYREQIRNWLPLPDLPASDDDEVIVHMRRTDFAQPLERGAGPSYRKSTPCQTPLNLLADAVECFGLGRPVLIVTDDRSDPAVIAFSERFRARVVSVSPKADFLTLCAAKNLVMSASTFSWWAAFLGNPRRVICPLWEGSPWHLGKQGNRNFARPMVTDDPRFEYPVGRPTQLDLNGCDFSVAAGILVDQAEEKT